MIQHKSRGTILSLESAILHGGRNMVLRWQTLMLLTCSGVLSFPSGNIHGSQAGDCLPPWNGCQQGRGYLVGAAPNPRCLLSVEEEKAFWEEPWEMEGSQWQKQNYLRGRPWCTGTVAISSKPSGALAKQTAGHGSFNHPCCLSVLRSKNPWMAARTMFWHLQQGDTKAWLVCSWRWGVSRAGWDLFIFCLFIGWFSWRISCMYKHFLPVFPCLCCFPWWIDVAAVIEWWFFSSLFSNMRWGELMCGWKMPQARSVALGMEGKIFANLPEVLCCWLHSSCTKQRWTQMKAYCVLCMRATVKAEVWCF